MRAATRREISRAARRVLDRAGPASVTMRAVADELGMTPPALYRYFAGRDDLLRRLADEIDDSLADDLRAALGARPVDDPGDRLRSAGNGLRTWALSHEHEYELVRSAMIERGFSAGVAKVFLGLFEELWQQRPGSGGRLTVRSAETSMVFLSCSIRLYGFLDLEVRGRVPMGVGDTTVAFQYLLAEFIAAVGPVR
ncbi:helix-turn-helix domain-containing protein [Actinomadura fulvescens]|uniref:TetR/AcrR family transcriptional regulator n=1 Tax=Actinomadura fulvescens TaxID=46160 RepID=A0ABN3PRH5_9ACTN